MFKTELYRQPRAGPLHDSSRLKSAQLGISNIGLVNSRNYHTSDIGSRIRSTEYWTRKNVSVAQLSKHVLFLLFRWHPALSGTGSRLMASISNAFSLNFLGNGNHIHFISFLFLRCQGKVFVCSVRFVVKPSLLLPD
jgi:hypothetical protein